MIALLIATLAAVGLLLPSEARGWRAGIWTAKPLASTGFVAAAVAGGAGTTDWGCLVVLGLLLAWVGDVLLIPRSRVTFLAGLTSFLLCHLAYAAAFVVRGVDPGWLVGAAVLLVLPAVATIRWLDPHIADTMRRAVLAYVVVITAMLACAAGTVAHSGGPLLLLGAGMFFVSDLAVARNRFVAPGFANKIWGLPLYYGGQLLVALSATTG